MEIDVAAMIKDFGFPVIAAFGMGYFIFFIWKWVIRLVDRVRMLDNDMIRLNSKLSMVLEYRAKLNPERSDELQRLVDEYKSTNQTFNSTGKPDEKV
jgi:hypothetical protein